MRWVVISFGVVLSLASARDELTTLKWHLKDLLSLIPFTTFTWSCIGFVAVILCIGEASYCLIKRAKVEAEAQRIKQESECRTRIEKLTSELEYLHSVPILDGTCELSDVQHYRWEDQTRKGFLSEKCNGG